MLGKIMYTDASLETSYNILLDLETRIRGKTYNKQVKGIKDYILKQIAGEDALYNYCGTMYKIEYGKCHHLHNIGNNNEWPIYLVSHNEKCLIGSVFILWPIYGNTCTVYFKSVEGDRLDDK